MGQKVSPHGLRVGVIKDWNSKWYASKENFAEFLAEDNKVRALWSRNFQGCFGKNSRKQAKDSCFNSETGHGNWKIRSRN